MRRPIDEPRLKAFMRELGRCADRETRVYLTGGSTAVLFAWRSSTIDVDLKIVPESDAMLRGIPRIKEEHEINVELAAPDHFIPAIPGWEERSLFIDRMGLVRFYHYDPYGQALSKIERGHARDLADVDAMLERGLVDRSDLLGHFAAIEPLLYRYPALDPEAFRQKVEAFARGER